MNWGKNICQIVFGYGFVLLGGAVYSIEVNVHAIGEHLGQAAGHVRGVDDGDIVGSLLQAANSCYTSKICIVEKCSFY